MPHSSILLVPVAVLATAGCVAADATAPSTPATTPTTPHVSAARASIPPPPGGGLAISADITRATVAPSGKYFVLPSGNSTVPSPYGVQYIDGRYYAVAPGVVIAKYKAKYYLIPRDAKFGSSTYGYFCGSGWGWNKAGAGNSSKNPMPDGGIDAACLGHDKGWEPSTASNVLNADKKLLAAAQKVAPRWQYEADYRSALLAWIGCRVGNKVTTTSWWLSSCAFSAAPVGVISLATIYR